jgi:hypothetical protein
MICFYESPKLDPVVSQMNPESQPKGLKDLFLILFFHRHLDLQSILFLSRSTIYNLTSVLYIPAVSLILVTIITFPEDHDSNTADIPDLVTSTKLGKLLF